MAGQVKQTSDAGWEISILNRAKDIIRDGSDELKGESVFAVLLSAIEKSGAKVRDRGFVAHSELVELLRDQVGPFAHTRKSLKKDDLIEILDKCIDVQKNEPRKTPNMPRPNPVETPPTDQPSLTPLANLKRFDEKRFDSEFNALVSDNKGEQALSLLIDVFPKLLGGNMNRKEKLKHLTFAGRRLQNLDLGKYGVGKLKNKARIVNLVIDRYGIPDNGTFVDFGCGAHEPLALSTYFYANQFDKCVANDFLPIRSPEYAALSMYDIVTYMLMFPEEFLSKGSKPSDLIGRLKEIDLKKLREGDFAGGFEALKGKVDFLSCDIVDSELAPSSVSMLVSFAVFEHVMDIPAVTKYLYDITADGGVNHHFIDLADHRAYRHDGVFNEFSFLTEEAAAPNLNRLRMHEHLAAFESAGFEILATDGNRKAIPETTFNSILPRWADLPQDELETYSMSVTLRKS